MTVRGKMRPLTAVSCLAALFSASGAGAADPPAAPKAPATHAQISPADAPASTKVAMARVDRDGPAQPFILQATASDRALAENCLTQAIYYEAAMQPTDGQAAVAQTVLNRLRHPDYPKSVCGVVYEGSALRTGCQFSFTCDGSLRRAPDPWLWTRAMSVAKRALDGYVMPAVGEATYYHADYVRPFWRKALTEVTQIGAHIFYRWPGPGGDASAFTGRYAGNEADLSDVVHATDPRLAILRPAVLTRAERRSPRMRAAVDRRLAMAVRGFGLYEASYIVATPVMSVTPAVLDVHPLPVQLPPVHPIAAAALSAK